jgi:chemotaxis protein CheC
MQLTEDQIDALKELVNIGVGRAASVLNEMVDAYIKLQIPYIKVLTPAELQQELGQRFSRDILSAVQLSFSGSFRGIAELVFPRESASALVAILTGEDMGSPDLDAVKIGTLSEIGNIVINGVMGTISNVLKQHMNYGLPQYTEDRIDNLVSGDIQSDNAILLAQTRFSIEELDIIGDIILIFEVKSFDALLAAISREVELQTQG